MPQTFFLVDYRSSRPYPQPVRIQIRQREYEHDLVIMDFRRPDAGIMQYMTGVPVIVRWGFFPRHVADFYGYVHHLEPHLERQETANTLRVTCVGASFALRQRNMRSWIDATTEQVLLQISQRHSFHSSYDPRRRVQASIVQAGESDWTFLARLAQESGYTFFAKNTRLFFRDRRRLYIDRSLVAPLFSPTSTARVESFEPILGEATPDTGELAIRGAFVLNDQSEIAFHVMNPTDASQVTETRPVVAAPILREYVTGPELHSSSAAKLKLADRQRENALVYQADAEVSGDPRVHQGVPVAFTGLGERHDGMWYVAEADHYLDVSDSIPYRLTLRLGRPQARDDGRRPHPLRPALPSLSDLEPRLFGGVWRAG